MPKPGLYVLALELLWPESGAYLSTSVNALGVVVVEALIGYVAAFQSNSFFQLTSVDGGLVVMETEQERVAMQSFIEKRKAAGTDIT